MSGKARKAGLMEQDDVRAEVARVEQVAKPIMVQDVCSIAV